MTEAILDIKHWGNSLADRLPAAVARAAHLRTDQRVRVTAEDGRVIITPIEEPLPGLDERLARFDSARHGGELLASTALGAERW